MPRNTADSKDKSSREQRHQASGLTLIDVARVAGVSPITVSRALNRPELVSHKTREKVQRAVDQVGYIPNMLAGALASSQSKLVAVFVPTIANPIFSEMIQTLMERLSEFGYQVILGVTDYSLEKEESLLSALLGRRPDGIVLTGTDHSELTRKRLLTSGIPVVEAWDFCDEPIDMLVGFSHEEVGQAVARHLLAKKYQRFGVISVSDPRGIKRCNGLVGELHKFGVADVPQVILPPPATLKEGRQGLVQLLSQYKRPDIVVCGSDTLAEGVLAEAASRDLRVPEDIAVMGFGDLSSAAQVHPALSTVRLDGARIGTLIARALLNRLQNQSGYPEPVRINTGFVLVDRVSS